jgi:vitamin B12 transporter
MFIMVLAMPTGVHAQVEQRDDDTTSVLDMLVVTASRTEELFRDVSQSMEVVTPEEIRNSAGADLTDILTSHGIQVTYQNSRNYGNSTVTMRGFQSSQHGSELFSNILTLVDGRRAGMDSGSLFGLNNIERIEIIRGPGSVQYGSAGMGGVINVITKTGKEIPEARGEVGIGSFNEYRTSLFGSGKVGQFDIAAAIRFMKADAYDDGEGEKYEDSSVGGVFGYFLKAGWNFTDFHRLGVTASGSRVYKGASGHGTFASTATVVDEFKGKDYTESQDKELDMIDLIYEGGTESEDFSWLARYFFGKSSYVASRYVPSMAEIGFPTKYSTSINKFDHNGAQAQASWDHDMVHLTLGVDWLKYKFSQNQPVVAYTAGAGTARGVSSESTTSDIGAFLLGRLNLLENRNLVFSAGLRYDSFKVRADSVVNNVIQPTVEHSHNSLLPSFGIAYSPIEQLKLRASYGKAYRVPTPREYVGNFYMATILYIGDLNLQPEESSTIDFGFDFQWEDLFASASYFITDFTNYIGTTNAAGDPDCPIARCTRYINTPDVTFKGIEGNLRWNMGRHFGWNFDLTPYVAVTHLFTFDTDDGKKMAGISNTTFSGGLDFNSEEHGLVFSIKATSYKPPSIDSFSSQEPPDFTGAATVWDFSLTKDLFSIKSNAVVKLKVAVDNITNKLYSVTGDEVVMPGRSFYVGLIFDYN